MTDDCHELKNIKYQTMLLNSNTNILPKNEESTMNMESFLEKEKASIKKKTWSKLENGLRIKKLRSFAVDYANEKKLSKKEKNELKKFLVKSLERKKLYKTKEVVYNVETGKITSIPGLNFNKVKNKYTLKRIDKKGSIRNSLAPKTIKNKKKRRERKTMKTKIDINLKE